MDEFDHRKSKWVELDDAVQDLIENPEEVKRLVYEADDFLSEVDQTRIAAAEVLERLGNGRLVNLNSRATEGSIISASEPSSEAHSVKLPRLELLKFGRKITEWMPFWDQFKAIVDDKPMLPVNKFMYLRSVLEGEARRVIQGLAQTAANYKSACELLKERTKVDPKCLEPFAHLNLADEYGSNRKIQVDMLIGLDLYWKLMLPNKIVCHEGLVAQETVFGWVLSGSSIRSKDNCDVGVQLLTFSNFQEDSLSNFWELESVGIQAQEPRSDAIKPDPILVQFEKLVSYKEGRYEVALPWKSESVKLKLLDNKHHALRRLDNLSRKLDRDPGLQEQYYTVFEEYEKEGIIEEIPPHQLEEVVSELLENLYVDDWLSGADSPAEACARFDEACGMLKKAELSWRDLPAIELHAFGDASERGYGACVYVRVPEEGNFKVTLIAARGKVAPIKKVSLPRLELLGALLCARLVVFVKSALRLVQEVSVRCWTDSTVALAWIKGEPNRWKTFVANRVVEIQGLTPPSCWQHCPGKDNPADLISRGVYAEQLTQSDVWLVGPSWLRTSSLLLKENAREGFPREEQCETDTVCVAVESDQPLFEFSRWSSFPKALNIVGWVLRFVGNCKASSLKAGGPLTYGELMKAKVKLLYCAQREAFAKEINALALSQPLPKGSPLVKLDPYLDEEGLLRIKVRLENAELSFESKHPIIVPGTYIALLLVRFQHGLLKHAGVAVLVSTLRNNYWIIRLRQIAKRVEACINSRPLTFVGEEPDIANPLTPSHFLIGRSAGFQVELADDSASGVTSKDLCVREAVRLSQLEKFWNIWQSEYLRNLPCMVKGFKANCNLTRGSVVKVKEERVLRLLWPLGVITELYPGKDGMVRSAKVKTKRGFVTRPVQNLYNLEISDISEESVCNSPDEIIKENPVVGDPMDPVESITESTVGKTRRGRSIKVPVKLDL
ncbi:uncharacterized protein [Macrobrachium rosenbergii]|uniref:uncharacterized protein n=1 Tax=Macrobrachium rosenbergii TaxID=79674 RepID=UPI0034D70DB6